MTRIEIKSRVGPDGVLKLNVPVGEAEANAEVLVVVEATGQNTIETQDWQEFVNQTYGSCAGLDLEVPPDLPPESRVW